MPKVVSTGITALDKALMNGLPKGFTVLVTGPPGSGTELLAKQFAGAGVRDEIVVDSLDFFLEYYAHADVLSALRTIKAHTQHEEGVALLTMLSGVYDTRTQSGVEEIVDCIVELERVRHENEFRRYLVLRKVRNHPEKTGLYEYTITDKGITAT